MSVPMLPVRSFVNDQPHNQDWRAVRADATRASAVATAPARHRIPVNAQPVR